MRNWIRENSRFPKQIWNASNLEDMRTNNMVEGWHRFTSKHFGIGKNLWKFLSNLKVVEVYTKAAIALVRGCVRMRKRRKSQERKERDLRHLKPREQKKPLYFKTDFSSVHRPP